VRHRCSSRSEIQPVINTMAKYGNLKPFPANDVIWTPPAA
jgi:hypothetical protein